MSQRVTDLVRGMRPNKFIDIYGQDDAVRILTKYISSNTMPELVVLIGDYGAGKSALAQLTAKACSCKQRSHGEYEPCGECDACLAFGSRQTSCWESRFVDPSRVHNLATFEWAVTHSQYYGRIRRDEPCCPPIFIEDIDQLMGRWQEYLGRALDEPFSTFVIGCSAKPKKIIKPLWQRAKKVFLQPPDVSALAPWIEKVAAAAQIEVTEPKAREVLIRLGSCNYRTILSIMQVMQDREMVVSRKDVTEAAALAGE